MTWLNNLYLVVAAGTIAIETAGLLWVPQWVKVRPFEVGSLVLCLGVSLLPGFTWECRGLLAAALALLTAEMGHQHHWWGKK